MSQVVSIDAARHGAGSPQPPNVVFGTVASWFPAGNDYVAYLKLEPQQALHAMVYGLIGEADFAQRQTGVRIFRTEMHDIHRGTEAAVVFDSSADQTLVLQVIPASRYRP